MLTSQLLKAEISDNFMQPENKNLKSVTLPTFHFAKAEIFDNEVQSQNKKLKFVGSSLKTNFILFLPLFNLYL